LRAHPTARRGRDRSALAARVLRTAGGPGALLRRRLLGRGLLRSRLLRRGLLRRGLLRRGLRGRGLGCTTIGAPALLAQLPLGLVPVVLMAAVRAAAPLVELVGPAGRFFAIQVVAAGARRARRLRDVARHRGADLRGVVVRRAEVGTGLGGIGRGTGVTQVGHESDRVVEGLGGGDRNAGTRRGATRAWMTRRDGACAVSFARSVCRGVSGSTTANARSPVGRGDPNFAALPRA